MIARITIAVLGLLAVLLCPLSPARAASFDYIASSDGTPLCVYETGNPQGRPLLFIHGFSQSYAVFKRQFESDLAKDFRIVAFDLRGHGCSGKPWSEAAYTGTKVWADDVAAVIAARKLVRPVIIGWSFGGYVTIDYVRHYGNDVAAALVLVGSNAGLPPAPTDPAVLARLAAQREANKTLPPDIELQLRNGKQFVSLMTSKPAPQDMQDIMFATNQMMPPYARRAMSSLALTNDDLVEKITTPVFFHVGTRDLSQPNDVIRAVAARMPKASVQTFDGAGHALFIDSPEEFNAALRQVVQSLPAR